MDSVMRGTAVCLAMLATRAAAEPPRSLLPPPAHIAAFRTAWHDARACLVGDPMVAPTIEESLRLRPLSRSGGCAGAIAKAAAAARAGDADAGYHVAWSMLALRVAHVADDPREAIARVDDAENELRARAVASAVRIAAGPAVPKLAFTPLPGTENLQPEAARTQNDHVVWAHPHYTTQVSLLVQKPDRFELIEDSRLGFTRTTWSAQVAGNNTSIVAGGPKGENPVTVMSATGIDVKATLGADRERAVIAEQRDEATGMGLVWIVRSHDAGAHWDAPAPLADGRPAIVFVEAETADVAWQDADGKTIRWQRVFDPVAAPRAGKLAQPIDPRTMCGASDVLWQPDEPIRHLFHTDATGEHDLGDLGAEPWSVRACASGAAAVQTKTGVRLCTKQGCAAPEPGSTGADLFEIGTRGELIWAKDNEGYVVVSRAGKQRVFDTGDASAFAVVDWNGVVYLGLVGDDGFGFVALPAEGK
jgi:hypothetical protein